MKPQLSVVAREYNDSIEAQFKMVGETVDRAQMYLEKNNLDEGLIALCSMVITEAINNIIEHSYSMSVGMVDLNIHILDRQLVFTFIDSGLPAPKNRFEGSRYMPNPEDLPESGWGLALIETIVDDVNYRRVNETNELALAINL